jgi:hypothetical protein
MDIGKPQRVHRVEPVKDPVPASPEPAEPLKEAPATPKEVPTK